MKKILLFFMMGLSVMACNKQQEQQNDTFNYHVDSFYDLEVLRYQVPGLDSLSTKQKELLYYLNEAALWGRDIIFDQHYAGNLAIRKVCETIYTQYDGDKNDNSFLAFEKYLKRVWFANGIHHHYSGDKFVPECSKEWFIKQMNQYDFSGIITDNQLFVDQLFDPAYCAKQMNQTAGEDLVLTSAGNLYEGLTQAEAEAYYAAHKDNSAEPLWIGLNSKLVKRNGKIEEEIYRVGGLYGPALEHVVYWLEKALQVAETKEQRLAIQKLIEFNRTGDLKAFNEYCIAWVQDTLSQVDFVNGFTETYSDPLGITGSWESLVNFRDEQATHRAQLIAANAQWFEDNSPTDKKYKKNEVKGVSAKVINAFILAGDCYPATPIGINLPNANWIRKEYGSKSVTIDNITDAYNKAALGNGFNEEFMLSAKEISWAEKYGAITSTLHTDLHECAGHGSGKLLPGVSKDALKEHASTIEEARADLFGLYYMADQKLLDLGLLDNKDAYQAAYYQQLMNGLMTQLVRIEPGKNIEEAHMRDRQLIARWVYEHATRKQIALIKKDGKTYLQINDYKAVRNLFGQLLALVQEITSTGDYTRATELVETYAVKVDPQLHAEILQRYEALHLAPYKGFVNPRYTPVYSDDNQFIDLKVDYTEGYVEQQLRYSQAYSAL